MHQTILNHARYRWLWGMLILVIGSIVGYVWHTPIGPPNGGSVLGYTLGTIGALLIFWLMWFGVRKRRYFASGSARGWLSAHVYLGTGLIIVGLLHSGFQFGWNIHTAALILMLVVIVSGFFGVYAYLRYPSLMTQNRQNTTRDAMVEEIREIDKAALGLADQVDTAIHDVVLRSIQRTKLGGGVWDQLTARDASDAALVKLRQAVMNYKPDKAQAAKSDSATMVMMVDFLASGVTDKQGEALRKLLDLMSRKQALASRVARDIQLQAMMDIWLYFHVPLSFALLAALIAHIVAVFFYW